MRIFLLVCLAFLVVGCSTRQEALNSRSSFKQIREGARLLAKGNKPLALKAFDRAVAGSSDRDVYLAVIGLLVQEDMYRESMPYIRRAIAIPDIDGRFRIVDSELHTVLGDCSWKVGDFAQAEAAYREAIRLNKDNATAYNDWGYMLAESNQQLDKALELTRKAVALQPRNGMILDSLGWAYFQKGDAVKAVEYLKKAAQLCHSDTEVRFHYARALDAVGDYKTALVEYHKVLKLSPSNTTAKKRIRTLSPKNTSK